MSHEARPSDRSAAFTGVIVGAIFVIIVVVVISKLTSKKFEGKEGEKSTASATR